MFKDIFSEEIDKNLTFNEQEELDRIVSRILAKGIEGLTLEQRQRRVELLFKKYGEYPLAV